MLVLTVVMAGPLAVFAIAWAALPDELSPVTDAPAPVWAAISELTVDERTAVVLEPELVPATAVVPHPRLAGLVTDVDVYDGDALVEGSAVLEVEDRAVVAVAGPAPFHRDLSNGRRGADVLRLNELLERLGFLDAADVDDRFGSRTRAAVKRFNEELRGEKDNGVFAATHTVWMPEVPFVVGAVAMSVGDEVSGGVVVSGLPRLEHADLVEPDGPALTLDERRRYRLHVDGFPVVHLEGPATSLPAAALPTALAQHLAAHDAGVLAELSLAEPEHVLAVPASAVYGSGTGIACVVVDVGGADSIAVDVVGGTPGAAWLAAPAGYRPGLRVLTNPVTIGFPSC